MTTADTSKLAQSEKDAHDLERMGYVQELFRDMGGFANFAVSFSVISILTGGTQLYGYGLQHGGPFQVIMGWLIVSFFTITVALSMAELASSYPTAGALYHWSCFLGGKTLGWFTGCFNTFGQFAILAGINFGLAQFILGLFEIPATPLVLTSLYAAILLSQAILNHRGIRVVAWLNSFSAWYHIAVVCLILGLLSAKGFVQPAKFLLTFKSSDGFRPAYSFLIGLLLAQWTLMGYDASAHVTEETVNPRKNAPWGIFIAVVVSIISGFAMMVVVTLSIGDLDQTVAFGDAAFSQIMKARLGNSLGTTIVALTGGAMWLCGLASMASASRMVYAFARDGGLPAGKFWARVSPKYRTPANAIWGLTIFAGLLAVSVSLYSAVVSIATITLYVSYGLPILARLWARRQGTDRITGPWNLGRFSSLNATVAVVWIIFISMVFVLPPNNQAGYVVATMVIGLGLLWTLYVRHRFVGPKLTHEHFVDGPRHIDESLSSEGVFA